MSQPTGSQPTRSHPTGYQVSVFIPEPTDAELRVIRATEVKTIGHDLKDGRMMAGMGDLFAPTAALAAAVFRTEGIEKKHREFIVLRTAKLLNCPHPWDPNVRVAQNTGATLDEIEALTVDGPVTGLDEESNLIVRGADEMTLTGTLTDQTLSELRARYSDEICRKFVLVFAWYNLFTRWCNGCRVGLESPDEVVKAIGDDVNPV